jgi:hypothetical protein
MDTARKLLLGLLGGGSSAPAFSPLDIANLALWLDANDSATLFQASNGTTPAAADGDVVGYIADKSGNLRHFTQATTANKPTVQLAEKNGCNVLRFDGTDDQLETTATNLLNLASTVTVFAVAIAPNTGGHTLFAQIGSQMVFYTVAGFLVYEGPAQVASNNSAAPANTWRVFTARRAGTGAGETQLYVNGTQNDNATAMPNGATTSVNMFGGNGTGTSPWQGDIAELLVYHAALTPTDRAAVETYLNTKWAVY